MSNDLSVNDNPFDPASTDWSPTTIPLDQVVELGLRKLALELAVWRPAKIVQIKGNGRVDIEILLQAKYIKSSIPFTLPTIQDALVSFPQGADYYIKPPMAVGDTGIALFCDRSLDEWSVQGGTVFPNDPRTHNISDCVFIPGVYPFNAQVADSSTDMVLKNKDAEIRLQKAGKFKIKNNSQELIQNLISALQTLSTASTLTGGPFIPSVVAALNEVISNLQTLEGS